MPAVITVACKLSRRRVHFRTVSRNSASPMGRDAQTITIQSPGIVIRHRTKSRCYWLLSVGMATGQRPLISLWVGTLELGCQLRSPFGIVRYEKRLARHVVRRHGTKLVLPQQHLSSASQLLRGQTNRNRVFTRTGDELEVHRPHFLVSIQAVVHGHANPLSF